MTAGSTRALSRSKTIQRETDHVPESDTRDSSPEILDESPKCSPALLRESLGKQKQAILNALRNSRLHESRISNDDQDSIPSTNSVTLQQLSELLGGSIERGEGNSCLVIGPAGSGKSMIFESALDMYEDNTPIVIRLNGHVHHTDRLAIREIARQVVEQTGNKKFESIDVDDDDNPFEDNNTDQFTGTLPPPSHLPSLIAALPTISRPVVVLLDAFNVFTEQPRQALLYCLLDTVQSCRAGSSSHGGLAVIGLTSRVDVVNLLEKRVKSRFSHRILRTSGPRALEDWLEILRQCLCTTIKDSPESGSSRWRTIWEHNTNMFLQDREVRDILKDMFGISRDIRCLLRVMTNAVICLSETSPFLTVRSLNRALESQRSRLQSSLLMKLDYPSLSLCIAAQHARTAGHDTFTFEMLHELFATQVRTSSAAPVMLGGGSIGMVNTFEELIKTKIFVQAASHTAGVGKEFVKYRCAVEREDVKVAVERIGQTNLKKWFSKAQ
ncbi:uncharacterized protein FOMMEDRAFT_89695 [Fomitiporia mediterranea MF3/22]|uniref:uncharacterized protein n=1 Tax=Fomitiporia mediterranea (strain MF3/22) TaxID=694068 RepID=UPI00044098C9|nr:uncharacterized protein FOMMEDRAFT_89695 [Fomitiporia mediterranea MF3/22]EJD01236.1 hypothetical protein FOMMEDRAFT_89695 [Fomitiporia mediterranea MF3/22]